jgi:hypothetical protein
MAGIKAFVTEVDNFILSLSLTGFHRHNFSAWRSVQALKCSSALLWICLSYFWSLHEIKIGLEK